MDNPINDDAGQNGGPHIRSDADESEQLTLPSPGQAPEPGQPGELYQAADVTAQETGSPPTRSRDRKVIVGAVTAVVLIAVGTVLGIVLSSGSSGPPFPGTLLGLTRDTGPDAQQVAVQAVSELSALQGFVANPGAAVYGPGPPDQGLLLLTAPWSAAAKAHGFIASMSAAALAGLKSQGATDAAVYPAGPHGGGMACGDKTLDGYPSVVCAWADHDMFGIALYFGVASSPEDGAAKTIQVRSAVEP